MVRAAGKQMQNGFCFFRIFSRLFKISRTHGRIFDRIFFSCIFYRIICGNISKCKRNSVIGHHSRNNFFVLFWHNMACHGYKYNVFTSGSFCGNTFFTWRYLQNSNCNTSCSYYKKKCKTSANFSLNKKAHGIFNMLFW